MEQTAFHKLIKATDTLERWLKLDRLEDAGALMRARAVYIMAASMVMIQIMNLISMSFAYGHFTQDHLISILSCVVLIGVAANLRVSDNFGIFAAIYSVLLIVAVLLSALSKSRGIHTSLLPLLMVGPLVNAFVSGRKAAFVYSMFGSGAIWVLFIMSKPSDLFSGADETVLAIVAYQRAFQGQIILLLILLISCLVTAKLDEMTLKLERMAQEAQRSEDIKTRFLANMSHELRTPLNGVIGMSSLLLRTQLDTTQRQYAEIVQNCSAGLVSIINDVLDLSKLDIGKTVLHPEVLDLRVLLKNLHALHLPNAESKGLNLTLDWDESLPAQVYADPVRLRQVAHNLVGNALKFTTSGSVRLSVRHDANRLREDGAPHYVFFVSDTGRGIPKEAQERIFDRFEQVGNPSEAQGTGLGLSIARDLVAAMGGELTVYSVEGQGTIFRYGLNLPLAEVSTKVEKAA